MERLYRFVAQRWVLWLALLFSALAMVAFAWFDRARPAGSPGVVALQLAFSVEAFRGILDQWGPAGVEAHRAATLYADFWFPIAYSILLCSLTARLLVRTGLRSVPHPLAGLRSVPHPLAGLRSVPHPLAGLGSQGRWRSLVTLPLVAAVLDWVENSLHLVLLRNPAQLSPALVGIASTAAAIKWGLLVITLLGIVALTIRAMGQRVKATSR